MTTHSELNNKASLQTLETARDEWIEQAAESGFLTLCYLLATELGEENHTRIQGPRSETTTIYVKRLPENLELVMFSSIGYFIPKISGHEEKHTVLIGKGTWPQYDELYCNLTLSNDPDRQPENYEFFVPGTWQEHIDVVYDEIHKAVSANDNRQQERRRQKLLDQLLIGKEI